MNDTAKRGGGEEGRESVNGMVGSTTSIPKIPAEKVAGSVNAKEGY